MCMDSSWRSLLVNTTVFVLLELALLDLFFPARPVSLAPLRTAGKRLVVPCSRVAPDGLAGLPLRRTRLLDFHASGKSQGQAQDARSQQRAAHHDLPPVGAGAAGAAPPAPFGG